MSKAIDRVCAADALGGLLPDRRISLQARGRPLATIASYLSVGESFTEYLSANGMPNGAGTVAREHVEQDLADMRERGLSPATVAYRSLQQLFRWLTDDGGIARSPMEHMTVPAVPEQPVPVLDDDLLAKLLALANCKGNTFENRRDTAIIRLLRDTGMRPTVLRQ